LPGQGAACEKAQASAYLLLASIRAMVIENSGLLALLQELPDVPPALAGATEFAPDASIPLTILECLLAIGVYSDCDSPVAPLAFRLVVWIARGSGDCEEDVPSTPRFAHPFYKAIVASYAEDFQFVYPVTNQVAAAFAVFWDHQFKALSPGKVFNAPPLDRSQRTHDPEIELFDADGTPLPETYPPRDAEDRLRPRPAFTPLEVFGHLVLCDPPHRDDLNRAILRVLRWYQDSTRSLRAREFEWDDREGCIEYQKALYECDLLFYNFLTTKFVCANKIFDMTHIRRALPMYPLDERLDSAAPGTVRAPLNGAAAEFGLFWMGSDFFAASDGPSAFASLPGASMPDDIATGIDVRRQFEERMRIQKEDVRASEDRAELAPPDEPSVW
jgi:hypothetical protein